MTVRFINRYWIPVVVMVGLISLSAVLAGVIVLTQFWLPQTPLVAGYLMETCIWRVGGQTHLLLYSPFVTLSPPPGSAQCLYVPWLPDLRYWSNFWTLPI